MSTHDSYHNLCLCPIEWSVESVNQRTHAIFKIGDSEPGFIVGRHFCANERDNRIPSDRGIGKPIIG